MGGSRRKGISCWWSSRRKGSYWFKYCRKGGYSLFLRLSIVHYARSWRRANRRQSPRISWQIESHGKDKYKQWHLWTKKHTGMRKNFSQAVWFIMWTIPPQSSCLEMHARRLPAFLFVYLPVCLLKLTSYVRASCLSFCIGFTYRMDFFVE